MSAAAYLVKAGYAVTVLEKNNQPGGRAYTVNSNGFTWELGPSWYMMPDVFDEFFADFGKCTDDYYSLQPLSPSYRVFDNQSDPIDIGSEDASIAVFNHIDAKSGNGLRELLWRTKHEYSAVRNNILTTDWLHATQALRLDVLRFLLNPEMIRSYDARINKYIPHPRLKRIVEFMTVFMGGSPQNIPGMYSLLAYVDMGLGIAYPRGGFTAVSKAFEALNTSLGVVFRYNAPVQRIRVKSKRVHSVTLADGTSMQADIVIANADYHHVQTQLLSEEYADISASSWERKTLSPSGLLVSLGVKRRLPELLHHNLFFDTDWDGHFKAVFRTKQWSAQPLFYACVPSKTDPAVAPKGHENVFVLAPQAAGIRPTPEQQRQTVANIIKRLERHAGIAFASDIVAQGVRTMDYFAATFNAYQGNAFGLAHTLRQSAIFRPRIKSRKVGGLYFVGQYTNPGTGVPMVVLSGKTVAQAVERYED